MEQLAVVSNSLLLMEEKEDDIALLLCPFCFKRIPFVSVIELEGDFELNLKCPCLKSGNQIKLRSYFRFLDAQFHQKSQCIIHLNTTQQCTIDCFNAIPEGNASIQFTHQYIQELSRNVQCDQHSQPFSFYDVKNQINICFSCIDSQDNNNNSSSNQLVPLGNIDLSLIEKNSNQISKIMNSNTIIVYQFILSLEKALSENKISQFEYEAMKNEIASALNSNEETNNLLKLFYKCFHYTASFLIKYPCYQLTNLFKTIEVDDKQFIIEDSLNISQSFRKIIHYLLTSNALIKREQYTCIASLSDHTLPVWSLKLLNGHQLASASYDMTIKLWDLSSFKCTSTLIGHSNVIFCLMNCDNDQLISCSGDRTIKIWNTAMSKCNTTLTGYKEWIYCLIKLRDHHLVSGAYDGAINLWSLKTFQCIRTLRAHQESVTCLSEMSNGRLASGSKDCLIKIWSLKTSCCITVIEAHSQAVCCLALLEDESLASGSSDNSIKVWQSETYKLKITLNKHKGTVWCLLPLSNNRLASCSDDRTIKIWNILDYSCIVNLIGHSGGISTLILINDNQIASGSRDNSIKIWNI